MLPVYQSPWAGPITPEKPRQIGKMGDTEAGSLGQISPGITVLAILAAFYLGQIAGQNLPSN